MKYLSLLLLFLFSCKAVKEVETKNHTYTLKGKEVRSFNKSLNAYNLNVQGSRVFSLKQFPTKDSTITKIEYREGKIDTFTQVFTEYDTITNTQIEYRYKYINRVDTLVKDSIITITDTREIGALKSENNKFQRQLTEKEKQVNKLNKIILGLVISLFASIVVIIFLIKR